MTDPEDIQEIAAMAAEYAGQNYDKLPAHSRGRWVAEVSAALNGGEDQTAGGQAARKAIAAFRANRRAAHFAPAQPAAAAEKSRSRKTR